MSGRRFGTYCIHDWRPYRPFFLFIGIFTIIFSGFFLSVETLHLGYTTHTHTGRDIVIPRTSARFRINEVMQINPISAGREYDGTYPYACTTRYSRTDDNVHVYTVCVVRKTPINRRDLWARHFTRNPERNSRPSSTWSRPVAPRAWTTRQLPFERIMQTVNADTALEIFKISRRLLSGFSRIPKYCHLP